MPVARERCGRCGVIFLAKEFHRSILILEGGDRGKRVVQYRWMSSHRSQSQEIRCASCHLKHSLVTSLGRQHAGREDAKVGAGFRWDGCVHSTEPKVCNELRERRRSNILVVVVVRRTTDRKRRKFLLLCTSSLFRVLPKQPRFGRQIQHFLAVMSTCIARTLTAERRRTGMIMMNESMLAKAQHK